MKVDLNKLEEKLYEYQGEDKIISSHELAEIIKNEPAPVVINTGFQTMDKILNGVEGGELVVVSGPTNHGKTTMLISITKNMADNGIKSSWFTLENSPRNFIKAISNNGTLPLFYLPSKNTENHIQWLIERIIEGCVKYNTRVVFIDHLHQIFSIEKMKGNISLELGDIVAQIKQIAIEYGLVIFLVAHCTDSKNNFNTEPTIRDIRDSGLISRLADVVIGVWRIKKNNNLDELKKEKVAENNDDDRDEMWNKVRIWKSRREGTWGTFYLKHENHIFSEVDITKLEGVDNYVSKLKSKDAELGF